MVQIVGFFVFVLFISLFKVYGISSPIKKFDYRIMQKALII